ncbi:MAG: aminotransferase class III-fold pyridoxal phosphate-dependent enzyme [Acidimicrobiales bacterium]|nr:aminotransferase class III-fold pyridoxal phosphate-dependent enzyme [Acidimicrobiales bacterium]MDG1876823.1 aminotransferase class III-fold pyridoxal phosphate-dependent enzyme [Acidimicrobiales bacterium]
MDFRAASQAHVVPHFTKGAAWKADDMLVMDRGEGCYVWDDEGNKYLDGLAGLFCTNLGHGRSDLAAEASKQMERMAFYPNWGTTHEPVSKAATLIAEVAPGDLEDTFFVSSGSEAVEAALKFARNFHVANGDDARYKVISREWSYHGTTLATLTVTGVPKFRKTFLPMMWDGVRHVRNTIGDTAQTLDSAKAIEEMILAEGPETVAMVIAEPVQNGRGCLVPPHGYWQELRRICDKYGVLLCADEVICSFGRLGHFFGSERFSVVPDLITFAKGVTSAYLPLGGVIVRRPLLETIWDSEVGLYNHGSTFGGHPVATAVAAANISAMQDERIMEHVLANESYMAAGFEALVEKHDVLREVRGTGYFYALEFMASRAADHDLPDEHALALQQGILARACRDAGLLIRPDDRGATMLVFSPPLIADTAVIDDMHDKADQVVTRAAEWLAGEGSSSGGPSRS